MQSSILWPVPREFPTPPQGVNTPNFRTTPPPASEEWERRERGRGGRGKGRGEGKGRDPMV